MRELLSFGCNWKTLKDWKNPFLAAVYLDRDAFDTMIPSSGQTIFRASNWTAKNPSMVTKKIRGFRRFRVICFCNVLTRILRSDSVEKFQ